MSIILTRWQGEYVRSVLGELPPGYDVLDDKYIEVVIWPATIQRCYALAKEAGLRRPVISRAEPLD